MNQQATQRLVADTGRATSRGSWPTSLGWLGNADALLVIALLALATGLLGYLSSAFGVDSWLELVAGRGIWNNGLPHHETLTVIAHGVRWVDQQWLSQLISYALYRLGGLGLLGVANVALLVGSIGGAVVGARRLGARPRTMLIALPVCVWLVVPAREVRTQELALPLFVAVAYLLASDSRHPSPKVYWCVPLMILWGNIHGTASLGALMLLLRGLTVLWERRGVIRTQPSQLGKAAVLLLAGPLALLVTPYGLQIVSYYRATLLNSALRHAVTEWQPITSSGAIAGGFFVLLGITLWSFGRERGPRTTLWEKLAFLALAAVSVSVIRNVAFLGLLSLIVVPLSLDGSLFIGSSAEGPARPLINAAATCTLVVASAIAVVATLARPASHFESSYQRPRVLDAVQALSRSDPSLKVLADTRFADWLLWRDPRLAGRLAADARFELLSAAQLDRLQRTFDAVGPDWKASARGYRVVVLDASADRYAVAGFMAEPGRRVLYDDGRRVVLLRAAGSAR